MDFVTYALLNNKFAQLYNMSEKLKLKLEMFGNFLDTENTTVTYQNDIKIVVNSKTGDAYISGTGVITEYPPNAGFDTDEITKRVYIDEGITGIDEDVFIAIPNLVAVYLPDTLEYIGITAFNECTELQYINIPDSVAEIRNGAFALCQKLNLGDMVFSKNLKRIGYDGLANTSVGSVIIPDLTNIIGAFKGSTITSVVIINPNTKFNSAFMFCHQLISVQLPEKLETLPSNVFYRCENLSHIDIPDTVKTIEQSVFRECSSLTDVALPNSLTFIGSNAFRKCIKLTEIEIPSSIETIQTNLGNEPFGECTNLTTIRIHKSKDSIPGAPWGATNATVIWDE